MEIFAPWLMTDWLGKPAWLWLAFMALVMTLLVVDLGVLHRDDHEISVRESLVLSAVYIGMGIVFGAWLWWHLGSTAGLEYFTGFFIEKSLAMDNVFVIAMIFGFFSIPRQYQHRVLFWGILGVIVLRAIMIGLGTVLISRFDWILYVFGAFLLITGIKMLVFADSKHDLENNLVLNWLRKHLRVTNQLHGNRFWVKQPEVDQQGSATGHMVWWATPLLLALVLIEISDVIFAVDSVPAIFAVTQDPYIVYTSNIFAVLGLRALYFALAAMIDRFAYLKYALALVLVFIGSKIMLVNITGKWPAWISLSITVGLIAGGVLYSLYRTRKPAASTSSAA